MQIVAALLLLLVACSAAPEPPPRIVALRAEPAAPLHVRAVVVAAERSIGAFDNATGRFARALNARVGPGGADIVRFSNRPLPNTQRSDVPSILNAIAAMHAGPNESCLVYVTGHGAPGSGVSFPRTDDFLRRIDLDRAITSGCGDRPTVVVISACFSGIYATRPVARDNRIVLTAARRDRPSFGCGVKDEFTYFDGCFLSAFEDRSATTWEDVAHAAIACVGKLEQAQDFQPSEPQLFVGKDVAGLKLPGA
jgi:Peptidase C13 family